MVQFEFTTEWLFFYTVQVLTSEYAGIILGN